MSLPVVYSFRRCPYAIRARMVLHAARVPWQHREVLLKNKPTQMLEASPKGTVPVMVFPDGRVLEESLEIIDWVLSEVAPEHPWVLSSGTKAQAEELIRRNDGPFKRNLDHYKYAVRYPDSDPTQARAAAEELVEDLEKRLEQQPQLFGKQPSYADVCLFPFMRQFRGVDKAWFDQTYPHTALWIAEWQAHPVFKAVMVKLPKWEPNQPPIVMPTQDDPSKNKA